MKKLLILCAMLVIVISMYAQKYNYTWSTADTLKASDYNYYPSSSGYDAAGLGVGSIVFTFTHTDIADSLNCARIEWKDYASVSSWTALTSPAALTTTTTDGQSTIYTSTPILHRYYRAVLHTAAGDTVKITNATLLIKQQ